MLIAVDQDVEQGARVFGGLGEVRLFNGRSVGPAELADADALVVRSVTRVDQRLLAGSRVRFVGSVTSGIDHLDTSWLAQAGIEWASAEGCNASEVAEYVLAAVLLLALRHDFDPRDKTLGVVGVGRIGSLVVQWAETLGVRVLKNDPPLQRLGAGGDFVGIEALAAEADIVTLHVPLTREGPDATWRMVDGRWLSRLKKGAFLVNTSRGDVVDEGGLLSAIRQRRLGGAVLDVWCDEPNLDPELVENVEIATPHVAGYSVQARRRGAEMIAEALAKHMKSIGLTTVARLRNPPAISRCHTSDIVVAPSPDWRQVVGLAVLQAVELREWDQQLREAVLGKRRSDQSRPLEQSRDREGAVAGSERGPLPHGRGSEMDNLRRAAASRHCFQARRILCPGASEEARDLLHALGFRVC